MPRLTLIAAICVLVLACAQNAFSATLEWTFSLPPDVVDVTEFIADDAGGVAFVYFTVDSGQPVFHAVWLDSKGRRIYEKIGHGANPMVMGVNARALVFRMLTTDAGVVSVFVVDRNGTESSVSNVNGLFVTGPPIKPTDATGFFVVVYTGAVFPGAPIAVARYRY